MPKKEPIFSRGYNSTRDRLKKNPKFCMCCGNCNYFYQAEGDTEDMCQNSSVLEYDMVVEENKIYCTHWRPLSKGDK